MNQIERLALLSEITPDSTKRSRSSKKARSGFHSPKCKVTSDNRYQRKDGTYPMVLYIYFNGQKKLIPLDFYDNPVWSEYVLDKLKRQPHSVPEGAEAFNDKWDYYENRAERIIADLGEKFTIPEFVRLWALPDKEEILLRDFIGAYVTELNKEGRISSRNVYQCLSKAIESFRNGAKVREVNKEFLEQFMKKMKADKLKDTSIGIYMRSLKSIMNRAIRAKIIAKEEYPFRQDGTGKTSVIIPKGSNIKKFFDEDEIRKIALYKAEPGSNVEKARDMWLFSYLANGMNFKDIARLRWENIHGDQIIFIRAKTENATKANPIQIKVDITKPVQDFMNKWGTGKNGYIFPVLDVPNLTPELEHELIHLFVANTNNGNETVAKDLKFNRKIKTYDARHSFVSISVRNGDSPYMIQQKTGHKSLEMLQNYIGELDPKRTMESAEKLVVWKELGVYS